MYGDFIPIEGVTEGAKAEGYHLAEGMTILKALYFFSHLADTGPLAPFIVGNRLPGQCDLPPPSHLPDPRHRTLTEHEKNGEDDFEGVQIIGGYKDARSHQFCDDTVFQSLQFEPWNHANLLGPKTWLATTLPQRHNVVLKLWDAWKFRNIDQIQEAKIYLRLKSIWGIYVPALLVQSSLEFYHCLVIQHVKVSLSHFQIFMS